MADPKPQSFESHARWVPGFHFGVFGVFLLNLLYRGHRLFEAPGLDAVMGLLMALALLGLFFYARTSALRVPDRVIRLEMRLRLERLLPADLRPRVGELTHHQLVALCFASDAELPELTRAVLNEKIKSRTAIKKRIRDWQADHLRA